MGLGDFVSGVGNWFKDPTVPDVSPDVPSWLAERYSNVAGRVGDPAQAIGRAAFDPRQDPMLRLPYEAMYKAGSAIKGASPFAGMGETSTGGGGGGSTTGGPVSSTDVAQVDPNAAPNITYNPLVNPLAANAFYATSIAPLLKQMDERYMANTTAAQGAANAQLDKFPMPAEFQSFFANTRGQQAQDQLNLHTALESAALQQPQQDAMMKQLGGIQSLTQQLYQQQQIQNALTRSGALTGGTGGANDVLAVQKNGKTGLQNLSEGHNIDGS